jgi:hypothetical protein
VISAVALPERRVMGCSRTGDAIPCRLIRKELVMQLLKSAKAATLFANQFKKHGLKRRPVLVQTKKGVVACGRKTSRKLVSKRGNRILVN